MNEKQTNVKKQNVSEARKTNKHTHTFTSNTYLDCRNLSKTKEE